MPFAKDMNVTDAKKVKGGPGPGGGALSPRHITPTLTHDVFNALSPPARTKPPAPCSPPPSSRCPASTTRWPRMRSSSRPWRARCCSSSPSTKRLRPSSTQARPRTSKHRPPSSTLHRRAVLSRSALVFERGLGPAPRAFARATAWGCWARLVHPATAAAAPTSGVPALAPTPRRLPLSTSTTPPRRRWTTSLARPGRGRWAM